MSFVRQHVKNISMYAPEVANICDPESFRGRQVHQAQWTFRLRAEFEKLVSNNWWMAFCTLTYNDDCLPHIPKILCKDPSKYPDKMPACFCKDDVRSFIIDLRQWAIRNFDACKRVDKESGELIKDNAIRYMICCEYGEHTQRPHMHACFCFPPCVPRQDVFNYIHESWSKGFVFPKNIDGGLDGKGYFHKPFVVTSVGSAVSYCSKYVCKDLKFFESFDRGDFRKFFEVEENLICEAVSLKLSDYMPFHMQSKSLGLSFLDNLTDEQKLDYLSNGVSFIGNKTNLFLPVYLKNKLIFDNYYIVNPDGKRLCRRKANKFFNQYKELIYEEKVKYTQELVETWRSSIDFALASRLSNFDIVPIKSRLDRLSSRALAEDITSYYGVNKLFCADVDRVDFWFSRYQFIETKTEIIETDWVGFPRVDERYLDDLNTFVTFCFDFDRLMTSESEKEKLQLLRKDNYYIDMYRSTE